MPISFIFRRHNCANLYRCPLSPYLFLVVMTSLFHDVHENREKEAWDRFRVKGADFDEILYADDTLLALRKLQVYKAIIITKVIYGLET